MGYSVEFARPAQKQFERLEQSTREKVARAVETIERDPYIGKFLAGRFRGYHSHRVWPFRIIYRIENDKLIVVVVAIQHRKDVYR